MLHFIALARIQWSHALMKVLTEDHLEGQKNWMCSSYTFFSGPYDWLGVMHGSY